MSLRAFKPTTPGVRGTVLVDRSGLWKGGPLKSLVRGVAKTGGRCAKGRVTAGNKGGGHRRRLRQVDFLRLRRDEPCTVQRLEYDPGRTAFLALVSYEDGQLSYILAPEGVKAGDMLVASESAEIVPGNALPLSVIPQGVFVHNVELKPRAGGKLVRSAGSSARLMGVDAGYAMLLMPSGEVRRVPSACWATVGSLSNPDKKNEVLGKAGRSRLRGRRPHVRGVAMNPIDHPHGGGEGRTSGGRHPVSPWGQSAKGKRTRRNRRTDKFLVKRRFG